MVIVCSFPFLPLLHVRHYVLLLPASVLSLHLLQPHPQAIGELAWQLLRVQTEAMQYLIQVVNIGLVHVIFENVAFLVVETTVCFRFYY